MSCRSATARTPPGRWRAPSPTRRCCSMPSPAATRPIRRPPRPMRARSITPPGSPTASLGGRADRRAAQAGRRAIPTSSGCSTQALADLARAGAELVQIDYEPPDAMGEAEFAVLLYELREDLAAYLASSPADIPVRDAGRRDRVQRGARRRGAALVRAGHLRAGRQGHRPRGLREGARRFAAARRARKGSTACSPSTASPSSSRRPPARRG